MNKFILILIFLCGIQISAYSQSNQIEAKAAYLLAEENFEKGDYPATLKYLETAATHLGRANSKLLYLQIQAELELYDRDRSYYDKVIKSITTFQNSADVKNFTEEKVLEIAKLKMQITEEHNKELEEEKRKNEEIERYSNNFRDFSFENWPIGISLSQLKSSHQDSTIIKKRSKSQSIYHWVNGKPVKTDHVENLRGDFDTSYGIGNTMSSIITQGEIVKGYRKIIYNKYKMGGIASSTNTELSYFEARKEIEELANKLSQDFGFDPVVSKNVYRWEKDNKIVELHDRSYSNNKNNTRWRCFATLEISEL